MAKEQRSLGRTPRRRRTAKAAGAAPQPRVTRLPSIRPARRTPGPRAAARAVAGPAAGDDTDVTFTLRDVQRAPVHDPLGIFTFKALTGGHQLAEQGRVPLRGTPVRFGIDAKREATLCENDLLRYRFTRSSVFLTNLGTSHAFDVPLVREPGEWSPHFTLWASLSPVFTPLKDVLRASRDITVLKTGRVLASMTGAAYDRVTEPPTVLAKTALLNIFYRLRHSGAPIAGTAPWFSSLERIVAIGRERILAYVEPGMLQAVRAILDNIEAFKEEFEPGQAILHRKNVPAELRPHIADMVSIKSTHRKANYQLTLTEFDHTTDVLLDADIDESGTFWGHFGDLFKHKITGGTHPVDIHEILVFLEGHQAGFDLGYTLI